MRAFTDSALRIRGNVPVPLDLGKRLDRIARYRRSVMDGATNALTVEGDCFRVDADDQSIRVYWTGGLTEDPTELATLPADRFDVSQGSGGDGWTITPKAMPSATSSASRAMDSKATRDGGKGRPGLLDRAALAERTRDARLRTTAHLTELNRRARERWGNN